MLQFKLDSFWHHFLNDTYFVCTFGDVYEMVPTCVETMGSFDRYAHLYGEVIMGVTNRQDKYDDLNI